LLLVGELFNQKSELQLAKYRFYFLMKLDPIKALKFGVIALEKPTQDLLFHSISDFCDKFSQLIVYISVSTH